MKILHFVCIASIACLSSCSSGPSFEPVKGTVTIEGKPVNYGVLTFSPDSTEINPGRSTTIEVYGGSFDASDVGVKLGKVKINLITVDLGSTVINSPADYTPEMREKNIDAKTKSYGKNMTIESGDVKIELTSKDEVFVPGQNP